MPWEQKKKKIKLYRNMQKVKNLSIDWSTVTLPDIQLLRSVGYVLWNKKKIFDYHFQHTMLMDDTKFKRKKNKSLKKKTKNWKLLFVNEKKKCMKTINCLIRMQY